MTGRQLKNGVLAACLIVLCGGFLTTGTYSVAATKPRVEIDEKLSHEFFTLCCIIMEHDAKKRTLVAGERLIELIDMRRGYKHYKTLLRDAQGNTVPFSSFKAGKNVYIRGFEQPDGSIKARELYLLPDSVTGWSDIEDYSFVQTVPVWNPE